MKTYDRYCEEIITNGGILKDKDSICYYKPGYIRHREDGPACELNHGYCKEWYYNGKWIMRTKGDVTPEQVIDFRLRLL